MSHVDDGTLHAYLDGELTPVERARLEGHVAECAACRNRLEEERALIERASGLLGLAQPPERAAPPLHQLRRPSVVWRLRVPVAWAATVVLALGIGYYAGGTPGGRAAPQALSLDSPLLHSAAADSAAALSRQENKPLGYSAAERRQVVATPRPPAAAERQRRVDSAPALARRENDALGLVATQTRPGAPQAAKQAAPEPQVYIDGVPVRSLLDSASAQSGVIAIRLRDSARTPPASAPVAGAQRAALPTRALEEAVVVQGRAASNAAAERGALVATQWPIIRRGPARQILGAEPMGVPGLAVRNIRRSPTGEVVLVEQAIDSVTVIQLFQQRVETVAADSLAYGFRSTPTATERLARFIGGVRVEIAGPLSADSLNRLLEQVKPIGP